MTQPLLLVQRYTGQIKKMSIKSKKILKQLSVFFLSMTIILCAVQASVMAQKATGLGGELQGFPGAYEPEGESGAITINKIFTNIFGVLTIVGGLIFVVQFLLGALSWITSSGKPEKVQKAQDKMIHAAIGFIALVAAYGIAFIIGRILGIDILNPAEYIENFWK